MTWGRWRLWPHQHHVDRKKYFHSQFPFIAVHLCKTHTHIHTYTHSTHLAYLLQFPTVNNHNITLRFTGWITRLANFLHQLKSLDDECKNTGEAAHLAQNNAKLRANQAHVVVTLLTPSHANRSAYGHDFRVVRHEKALLEYRSATASIVQLKITGDNTFVFPALEYLASLVAVAQFAGCQCRKVLCHFRCHIAAHLNQYATARCSVNFEVEKVDGIDMHAGIADDRCRLRWLAHRRRHWQWLLIGMLQMLHHTDGHTHAIHFGHVRYAVAESAIAAGRQIGVWLRRRRRVRMRPQAVCEMNAVAVVAGRLRWASNFGECFVLLRRTVH